MTTKKNFPVSSQHGSSKSLLKDIRRNTFQPTNVHYALKCIF